MSSEMMLAFYSAFSQSESESTRGNILWGQEKRRQNGIVTITPGMFGFCKDADSEIAIDEEQAAAIRMIYQAYLDGDSLTAIKHRLEAMGVKAASGRDKLEHSGHSEHTLAREIQGRRPPAKDLQGQPV